MGARYSDGDHISGSTSGMGKRYNYSEPRAVSGEHVAL